MQESKTRQELLENTINHFNSKNRAMGSGGSCKYRIGNKGCAIGREISNDLAWELDNACFDTAVTNIFDLLPDRLKEFKKGFLSDIQQLHDDEDHWSYDGLSESGKQRVLDLCKTHDLQIPNSIK